MPHPSRSTALLVAVVAMAIGGVAVAHADPDPNHKVRICHGTASDTNPYVLIEVDRHAIAGHFDENGTAPGHGTNNHADILLDDDVTECPSGGGEDVLDG